LALGQVSSVSDKVVEISKEKMEGKKFVDQNRKHNKHEDLDTGVSSVK